MRFNWARNWFIAIVLCLCWLALAGRGVNADAKADVKARIKELQNQRLVAAKKARDYLLKQYENGYLPPGAADVNGFLTQLLHANKLVFQARLDLCDGKPARIKAIEETIKEVDPIVAKLEKKYKSGIANTLLPYHLALVQLLELKIALEKAKGGLDGK